MAKDGIRVHIYGDYDDKQIRKVQRDLDSLKTNSGQAEKRFGAMSKGMKIAGAAIAAAAASAAYGVVRFAGQSIGAASDLDESLSKTQRVFGDASQSVEKFAQDAAINLGLSEQAALEATSTFGNLFRAMGIGEGKASAISQEVVQLAADLASFNNIDIQQALDALRSGLVGETEPLRRLGVNLSAARIQAEAFRLGLAKTKDELDAGAKAQAAWSLITQDSALAAGDFARTSDGLANTQRILTASLNDAQATIGESLLEAIQEVSEAIGGPNGLNTIIGETARGVGDLVEIVPAVARAFGRTADKADDATDSMIKYNDQMVNAEDVSNKTARQLIGFIPIIGAYATSYLTAAESNNVAEQASIDNANAQAALEAGYAANADIADRMANANIRVAKSAMAAAQGTIEAAIATGQVPSKARFAQNNFVREMLDSIGKSARTAGSSASIAARSAEKMRVNFNAAAKDFGDASVSIEGDAVKVSQAVGTAFEERTQVFRNIVQTQVGIIQQATAELDSYADSVVNSVLGSLDFATVDAEGNPMTPEQIFNAIMGDIDNREAAVKAIAESNIMTRLPEALAQKILSLPPDAAIALANYFSANPAQLEALTNNYNALATFTETALGVPMAETFATIGDESAVNMIANAEKRIAKAAKAFKRYVKKKLSTTITVSVRYQAVNSLPGVSGGSIDVQTAANGGQISAGIPTLVGERGPELILPGINSTVVRSEYMPSGGGASITINVNAGMGTDGAEVGRQVVDAIKAYERRNGPVYASA